MKNMYGKELHFPEDVYYSEELLWVKDQGDNRVRVGISDLGVKSVKDLVFVQISPRRGAQVTKGESLGHVETTKGIWEIIAPLSGTLVEVNPPIAKGNANPIVDDPYGKGWLVDLELAGDNGSALNTLLKGSDAKTKEWIREKAEEVIPGADEDE
ncbi:MAG: glycine cleavage system protein H [Chloroflexota bacterium]|nr:MAG: glycine cleavage system protein H [Chloroflexota bacterium]